MPMGDMKQFEDRKKVVAAIYLNTMSTKITNAEQRERIRRSHTWLVSIDRDTTKQFQSAGA